MSMPMPTATGSKLGASTGHPQVSWGKSKGGYRPGMISNFTPEQTQLFQQLFGRLGPDSFLGRLASGDQSEFEALEQPAWRDFQGALGQAASRFGGMGSGGSGGLKSSGFKNTLTAGSSQFAQDLQSQRFNIRNQALRDLMGMSNDLLNQRPNETFLTEEKPSFLQSLFGGLGGGVSQGLGSLGGSWGLAEALKALGIR